MMPDTNILLIYKRVDNEGSYKGNTVGTELITTDDGEAAMTQNMTHTSTWWGWGKPKDLYFATLLLCRIYQNGMVSRLVNTVHQAPVTRHPWTKIHRSARNKKASIAWTNETNIVKTEKTT